MTIGQTPSLQKPDRIPLGAAPPAAPLRLRMRCNLNEAAE